jgi:lipopolysaccharide exporter
MKNIINNISFKSNYLKNITFLFSGTIIGKAILMIGTPVLSRLFTPEDFGILGVFTALLGFLTIYSTLRYTRAILLPKHLEFSAALFLLSICALFFTTVTITIVISVANQSIVSVLNTPQLETLIFLIIPAMFIAGLYDTIEYWSTKNSNFKELSISHISRNSGTLASQVGLGFAGFGSGGLIIGFIVGKLLSATILFCQVVKSQINLFRNSAKIKYLLYAAKRYKNFPIYSLPSNLLSKGSGSAVPILFSALFSPHVAGLYWFTRRLISIATDSLGKSVRQVFAQEASSLVNQKKNIYRLYLKNTLGLTALGALPVLLITIFAPPLFEIVFGAEWREAGILAQWMVVMGFVEFISHPSTELIYILNYQKWQFYFQVVVSFFRIGSILYGSFIGDYYLAIVLLSLSVIVLYLGQIIFISFKLKHYNISNEKR